MADFAERFMSLFAGMEEAHGCYILDKKPELGKKAKGKAFTKRDPITKAHWKRHLDGKETLGIIPIRADNSCMWGAVDIDEYDLDLATFSRIIYKKKLPMFPLRSKSGGCHLVIFLSEPVAASVLQNKLTEIAASLGYGKSEIFPKQTKVLVDKGDLGNWLNMPYFGGEDSSRYCLDQKGESMTPAVFLAAAEQGRLTEKQLLDIDAAPPVDELEDGPPCLQSLVSQGFPQGMRNNGLFALGVYCRKAYPDSWAAMLEEFNQKYMDPPLESKEVQTISKQLDKKDYHYKCNDQPLSNFCNSAVCRVRAFGVGGGSVPSMANLRKIPTDQPVWFLEVNGSTLEMNTEQMQMQAKFQKLCMDTLNVMPPKQSEKQWQTIIQNLLNNCENLDIPPEAGLADQFSDLVYVFCSDTRLKATSRDDLLLGKPWSGTHPQNEEQTRVFFRIKDIEDFLIRNGFRHYTRSQMISRIQSLGGEAHFFNIKGKGTNVWHLPEGEEQTEKFDLPEMKGDVL